ncbi:hypothetical protein P7K49_020747 [Saguinus oedipus]|uniref:Uncharacterized protein n=1 Tax=Saguinus oedipus TaxID=9490 RepID=A0ABQ9URG3_SAGOE|nr:hypothetical protein P7K49_020747 [Saguinus oedipus]
MHDERICFPVFTNRVAELICLSTNLKPWTPPLELALFPGWNPQGQLLPFPSSTPYKAMKKELMDHISKPKENVLLHEGSKRCGSSRFAPLSAPKEVNLTTRTYPYSIPDLTDPTVSSNLGV